MGVLLVQCLVCLLAALSAVRGQADECEMRDGSPGVCKPIKLCLEASEFILNGGSPKVCSFKNRAPVICCGTFPAHGHPSRPAAVPVDVDEPSTPRPTSKRPTYKTTYYFLTIFKTSVVTTPMTTPTTPVSATPTTATSTTPAIVTSTAAPTTTTTPLSTTGKKT